MHSNRRKFIRKSFASATGFSAVVLHADLLASSSIKRTKATVIKQGAVKRSKPAYSIRFSVIRLNHGHIYGQVAALLEGGGDLVSVYAKEPELLNAFTRRYSRVKVTINEEEIIEDNSIQLIASASIPGERAPLGIRAIRYGKDFMVDKPDITTLKQLKM